MRNEQSRPELLLSTERSDFAAAETCPNICRGKQLSPMLRNCCKFSFVGDGALDVPFRGTARFESITMLCRRAVWRILRRCPEYVIGQFLVLSNNDIIVGLFLRRANTVRPYCRLWGYQGVCDNCNVQYSIRIQKAVKKCFIPQCMA